MSVSSLDEPATSSNESDQAREPMQNIDVERAQQEGTMSDEQPLKHEVAVSGQPSAWPDYPAAVRGGGFVFVSGVRGGRPGYIPTKYSDLGEPISSRAQNYTLVDSLEGTVAADAWAAHDNMTRILEAAGTSDDQILRQRMWQRDKRYFPVYERVRKHWQPDAAPSSGLGVSSVGGRFGRWIGIESIAADIEDPRCLGARRTLTPPNDSRLPSASIYSQAVASGPLVFMAGHIPVRTAEPGKPVVASFDDIPEEGRFLATGRSHPDARDGPIAAQTWYVYNEIRRTLEGHGMSMADIVHVRVYLSDLRDFATFHRVHEHMFADQAPALCVVGFDEVGHKNSRIEIEPTALVPGLVQRDHVSWSSLPPYGGPAGIRAGPLLFFAGMNGLGPDGFPVIDASSVDAEARPFIRSLEGLASDPCLPAQVWCAWRRLEEACANAGCGLEAIAKTVVYLRNERDLNIYEAVRTLFVDKELPAFDCVLVPGPGPVPQLAIQIDATAIVG